MANHIGLMRTSAFPAVRCGAVFPEPNPLFENLEILGVLGKRTLVGVVYHLG